MKVRKFLWDKTLWIAAYALVILTFNIAAQSKSLAEKLPVEAFADLPQISNVRLSPDGTAYAYISRYKGEKVLIVNERLKGTARSMSSPERVSLRWFVWANNNKLLVSYDFTSERYGRIRTNTRLFAVDRDLKSSLNLYRNQKNQKNRMGVQLQDQV
ncbi:MAG TPA: hypothetical protein ENI91_04525, partial [Sphingomonadales bacterium]|nr:hypothetical protein [Sphingomonadales bacterium]